MSTVALIPARGGSKRLPRKNILNVDGKPMLAYPIEMARSSGLFDRVVVSTEDEAIAHVAKQYGAEVLVRPHGISGDRATVAQACLHALEIEPQIQIICCIYATAILLRSESVIAARKLLDEGVGADFVMGVSEFEHPPVQALTVSTEGYLSYMWPEWRGVQSQSYPDLVVSNGTFYWGRRDALLNEKTFYGRRLRGVVVPHDQVSDIDTQEDLDAVTSRLRQLKAKEIEK